MVQASSKTATSADSQMASGLAGLNEILHGGLIRQYTELPDGHRPSGLVVINSLIRIGKPLEGFHGILTGDVHGKMGSLMEERP